MCEGTVDIQSATVENRRGKRRRRKRKEEIRKKKEEETTAAIIQTELLRRDGPISSKF